MYLSNLSRNAWLIKYLHKNYMKLFQFRIDPVDFVGEPIEHGDFIYFFYREQATEYFDPVIYSRVVRVCKVQLQICNPL